MRFSPSITLAIAANLLPAVWIPAAFAQTQQQIDWCVNKSNEYAKDLQINGCTASIQSGKWSGKNLSWAFGNRCIAYKDKGQYSRALQDCKQALALNPNNDHVHNSLGAIYHLTKKYDQAIEEYSTVIRLNPKTIDAWHNRGMSYAAKGDLDTAITDYNAALRIDPRDAVALYARGTARQKKGDKAGGQQDIDAAKQIKPNIAG